MVITSRLRRGVRVDLEQKWVSSACNQGNLHAFGHDFPHGLTHLVSEKANFVVLKGVQTASLPKTLGVISYNIGAIKNSSWLNHISQSTQNKLLFALTKITNGRTHLKLV